MTDRQRREGRKEGRKRTRKKMNKKVKGRKEARKEGGNEKLLCEHIQSLTEPIQIIGVRIYAFKLFCW